MIEDPPSERENAMYCASRWRSWDGNPDMLSGEERDELREIVGSDDLWDVFYYDLQVAADLLAEKYERIARGS